MTIFDQFTRYGHYLGEDPDTLTADNIDDFIDKKGEDWIKGYLAAVEVHAVNIADILIHRNDVTGRFQPPTRVRNDVRKYWAHNKSVYLSIVEKLESRKINLSTDANEPK